MNDMKEFKTHVYNIRQQNVAYRQCKENLKPGEEILHIDFSENYNCKLAEEVQSYHFGASRAQASLHTGVLYIGGQQEPMSFCSISACSDPSPAAIWAHLDPILDFLVQTHTISVLHFFSDGPSTQYRPMSCKGNW